MANKIKPADGEPAIRQVMMPKNANPDGDIFGGIILAMIDTAAAVEAQRQSPRRYVTVAMDAIQFHHPVAVGDIVSLWSHTEKVGRSSILIHVEVLARPRHSNEELRVTEAMVTMVAVDENRQPVAIFADE